MTFAEYFIKRRRILDLSQVQIAEIFGYSENVIFRWEQGQSIPKVEDLPILAETFNVPLLEVIEHNVINIYNEKQIIEKIDFNNVSRSIKYLRKKNNASQYELSVLLDKSTKTISRIEDGSSSIDINDLKLLADKFKVAPLDILRFDINKLECDLVSENYSKNIEFQEKTPQKANIFQVLWAKRIGKIATISLASIMVAGIALGTVLPFTLKKNEDTNVPQNEVEQKENETPTSLETEPQQDEPPEPQVEIKDDTPLNPKEEETPSSGEVDSQEQETQDQDPQEQEPQEEEPKEEPLHKYDLNIGDEYTLNGESGLIIVNAHRGDPLPTEEDLVCKVEGYFFEGFSYKNNIVTTYGGWGDTYTSMWSGHATSNWSEDKPIKILLLDTRVEDNLYCFTLVGKVQTTDKIKLKKMHIDLKQIGGFLHQFDVDITGANDEDGYVQDFELHGYSSYFISFDYSRIDVSYTIENEKQRPYTYTKIYGNIIISSDGIKRDYY